MLGFLELILGTPLSRKSRDIVLQSIVEGRTQVEAHEFLSWATSQNTEKSGALLAAQAIFLVVETFVLDRGWPKAITLAALFLMLLATLLLMTNLRTAWWNRRMAKADWTSVQTHIFNTVISRALRFNIALYMTFLSIILLVVAAAPVV